MSQGRNHDGEEIGSGRLRSSGELSRMLREGRSFSGQERHCVFLNTGSLPAAKGRFANVSAVSGLDFPDDGRAVALVDWDHDGDVDLWFSNRNAPRLRLMRNDSAGNQHFLALRLVGNGKSSNRDAIGARVEVITNVSGAQKHIRSLRAGEGFLSQSSKWIHVGLGAGDTVEKVIVHWPDASQEEFSGIEVDHRYSLVQGSGKAQDLTKPPRETKLAAAEQQLPRATSVARIPMVELLTVPKCKYENFDGSQHVLPTQAGRMTLVNLWSISCLPCMAELDEFKKRHDEIREKGIDIFALSVDSLGEDASAVADAKGFASRSKLPFTVGKATEPMIAFLQSLHDRQFPLNLPLPLPASFLIDRDGRLAVIYKGTLSVDELLADVEHSDGDRSRRFARSSGVEGRLISHALVERTTDDWAASLRFQLASDLNKSGRILQAATEYAEVLKLKPNNAEAHNNMGNVLHRMRRSEEAIEHFRKALRIKPDFVDAYNNLGVVLQSLGRIEEAMTNYREALQINPDHAAAKSNLETLSRWKANNPE